MKMIEDGYCNVLTFLKKKLFILKLKSKNILMIIIMSMKVGLS